MEKDIHLTDLIDVETLQKVQDAFAKMTNIAALTTDENGVAVTQGSNISDFCMKYTRNSPLGKERCQECNKKGAQMALKDGVACTYYCHAGLMEFAAPIMAGDKLVGCFIGGQVLTGPVDIEKIRQVAQELSIDEDEYAEAAEQVSVMDKETIDRASDSLYTFANVLSHMAYSRHEIYEGKVELEKVARMKSDFLANMSHEIRTPMNAVIGMAEMALREELTPAARDYVSQIISSGKLLLAIINDILDFSKIETGKMDIISGEYEPFVMLSEVVNMIVARIGKKDVELVVDIVPDLPSRLYGDVIRIKQILTNLTNNAVKFTQKGKVHCKIWYEKTDEEHIMLHASVEDTGVGIKRKDLGMLFQSFQQVDSKRNRNIEGTGLGLAISKQLLLLMDGDIEVESEYEKGSTFSVSLPQRVVDWSPGAAVEAQSFKAAVYIRNPYVADQLRRDMDRVGAELIGVSTAGDLERLPDIRFLFLEMETFSEKVEGYLKLHPAVTGVLLLDFQTMMESRLPNLHVMKKPVYSYNLAEILSGHGLRDAGKKAFEEFTFIAPDARVLIVDDNEVNLTVAKGLLKPLKMKIETAMSGKEAAYKISAKMYDLIFMDHMMPEIDGIETTRIIRRLHPEYADVPIIALTANVVDGTWEMFIEEEMNDLVAKPIDMKDITDKVRRWLPKDKIVRITEESEKPKEALPDKTQESRSAVKRPVKKKEPLVRGLDTDLAVSRLGSEELFWGVLKDYYHAIERKARQIKQYEREEEWDLYTIEVHALKSSSRQIGAMALGSLAEELEEAGKKRDIADIHKKTNFMLSMYLEYQMILKPYFPEEEKLDGTVGQDVLKMHLLNLRSAASELNVDVMDGIIKDLSQYRFSDEALEYFEALQTAVEDLDAETCEETIDAWMEDIT